MVYNYLLLRLFGLSACFSASTFAHEALVNGFLTHHSVHQVSVQLHGHHGHVGGGGIIGDRFVLTAAHCVLDRNRHLRSKHITVLAGTANLNETEPPAVTVRVEKVFFPLEYQPIVEFNHGNIAILELANSLPLEHWRQIGKLALPRNYEPINEEAAITGFGWNIYNNGNGSSDGRLRIALADILSNDECERSYPDGAIHSDEHFCARARPSSACIGDVGGPLVQNNIVVGILSRIAPHCDEGEQPAVYTRVVHYLRQIVNVVVDNRDPQMISRTD